MSWLELRQHRQPSGRWNPLVSIRRAKAEDAVAIWEVLKAAVRPLAYRLYSLEQVNAWIEDEAPQRLNPDSAFDTTVFVAESERRIVGFSRSRGSEVEALYVHPDQAGHKVGALLLRTQEQSALVRNVTTLYLDAVLNAVGFYQFAGYRIIGPSTPSFDNGVILPCIRMEKRLHVRPSTERFGFHYSCSRRHLPAPLGPVPERNQLVDYATWRRTLVAPAGQSIVPAGPQTSDYVGRNYACAGKREDNEEEA